MNRLAVTREVAQTIADELGAGVWQLAWTVATVTDLAVMEAIRGTFEEIIEGGGTMRDWLSMLDDMGWRSPLGAWHEETIFRTMLGQVMEGERYGVLTGDPNVEFLIFDAIDDDRVDEECLSLDGQAWPRDEFPGALWPPIHFNCRCSVIPADESDLKDLGASAHFGPPPLDHVQEGFGSSPSVEGLTETLRATAADALREGGWGVHAPTVPGR
jgi:uncharacterized protein with gpF-like domain